MNLKLAERQAALPGAQLSERRAHGRTDASWALRVSREGPVSYPQPPVPASRAPATLPLPPQQPVRPPTPLPGRPRLRRRSLKRPAPSLAVGVTLPPRAASLWTLYPRLPAPVPVFSLRISVSAGKAASVPQCSAPTAPRLAAAACHVYLVGGIAPHGWASAAYLSVSA